MEKETKKFVAGTITGVAIGIGGILLVMKLGENYRLVNPFVRIQEETIDNEETERDLPSWRYSDSIGNTTQTDGPLHAEAREFPDEHSRALAVFPRQGIHDGGRVRDADERTQGCKPHPERGNEQRPQT